MSTLVYLSSYLLDLTLEAQSHGQYLDIDVPESRAALREVAEFFDRRLDR